METDIQQSHAEYAPEGVATTSTTSVPCDGVEEVAEQILSAAALVHRAIGADSAESMYEDHLAIELERRGIPFVRQVKVPCCFKCGFVINFIVGGQIIVELNAANKGDPIQEADVQVCMHLTGCLLGLLIDFSAEVFDDRVVRKVY